ncbi:SGNH/GDSL hydrolase family protein [Cohnella sp. GCM10012308]|uniref:SGNH/GDSL hydrolase family protein n=1 Tax=Cohnella sp. GCM10012308 TaxID=3317329 RepID=UPI00361FD83F
MSQATAFWTDPAYYRNLLALKQTSYGVQPVRFTERQLAHFSSNEAYRLRSQCPAGICLVLQTDAEWLELDVMVEGTVRDYAQAMAAVNGRWTSLQTCEPLGALPRSATFRFLLPPTGEAGESNKVEIYLSQFSRLSVAGVRLSPGASVAPASERSSRRLLSLGDSITQGFDSRNPAGAYPVRLARLLDAELLNQGVGQHDFDPDSFDPALPYEPDLITVAYGVNDWAKDRSSEEIAADAGALLTKIATRYDGVPILVITPIWAHHQDERKAAGTLSDVRRTIADAVASADGAGGHVHVVDGTGLVPGSPYLFADGVHPTEEGFGHYAVELHRHAKRFFS